MPTSTTRAWVTLLTQPSYLIGVRALRASLAAAGSAYPLAVMVTDGIDDASRRLLADEGCLLRPVTAIRPTDGLADSYANVVFAEVWTKLAAWRLTEFERVVVLDADMLVVRNMDELLADGPVGIDLPAGSIAACHACRCNPNRIESYPASWNPQNCFYTHCREAAHTVEPGVENYLNGGLLVLTPDEGVYADLVRTLAAVHDLSRYPFAEQDFLNDYYRGRWQPLPYVYNALKTLPDQHPALWDAGRVRNIHYIIGKPWNARPEPGQPYYELNRLWWDVAQRLPAAADAGAIN